jgi:hypothetical protein
MRNPWLDISEIDYVGHMSSPTVNQRPVLSRLMGDAIESVRPRTMLVLGCSTGNGLEHVNPEVTSRVTVVDLNPAYLLRLGERFPNPGFELVVQCADLADVVLEPEAFELVHAALRWCSKRRTAAAIRHESSGHADHIRQIAVVGVAVSLRRTGDARCSGTCRGPHDE